jgi:ribosomal protein S18 acetylase RimI-like enzyme
MPPSAPDILIRPARADDLPGIVHVFMGDDGSPKGDVWNEETRPLYEAAMASIFSDKNQHLLVVEEGGAVIGTCQVTFIPGLVARGRLRAKLESVHVRPEWRGQGVGERLVRHAIEIAREGGARIVELSSNKSRLAAHRFYVRLGFSQSHEGFKLEL